MGSTRISVERILLRDGRFLTLDFDWAVHKYTRIAVYQATSANFSKSTWETRHLLSEVRGEWLDRFVLLPFLVERGWVPDGWIKVYTKVE